MAIVVRLGAAALAAALLLTGCASTPPGEPRVHLDNASDQPVGVYVNGSWVGTYEAGAKAAARLYGHGGPPFDVEVRSASDERLIVLPVTVSEAASVATGQATISSELSLDCGVISVAIGTVAPTVVRGAGEGGGCR